MLDGGGVLGLTQLGHTDRGHKSPMSTHGTELDPPPPESESLEGPPGDPDRGEQMASATPHHGVAAESNTTLLGHDELGRQ